jgi:hypothetical protein
MLRYKNAHYALHNSAFCALPRRKCTHFDFNPKFEHPPAGTCYFGFRQLIACKRMAFDMNKYTMKSQMQT